MNSTAQLDPTGAQPVAGAPGPRLIHGLEEFWPSRRGHAFDEFCR